MTRSLRIVCIALAALLFTEVVTRADEPANEVSLTIENNRFYPEEIKVKAGTPFVLIITNKDQSAEEFESLELRIEKIIPAGKTLRLRMPALKPGTYRVFGDFHEKTAKGRIVAE